MPRLRVAPRMRCVFQSEHGQREADLGAHLDVVEANILLFGGIAFTVSACVRACVRA